LLRRLTDVGTELANDSFDPNGRHPQEIIDAAIVRLMGMQREERLVEFTAKQAAKRAYDVIVAAHANGGAVNTVPTGLAELDEKLGGLDAGDLSVVGARAAMGKTALLSGFALYAATKARRAVGFISGEQAADQIAARMMASDGRTVAKKFRTGRFDEDDWP